jgi:menaquinone-specific isochorismate synthase
MQQSPLSHPASYLGKPTYTPDQKQWRHQIEQALDSSLEKIVLARRCSIECTEEIDPFAVASALEPRAKNACLFCLQTPDFSFVGASPERLFRREGRRIWVEAMAGTRKRGNTPEEDEKFKQELLHSEKDRREIFPIQKFFQETLQPWVDEPVVFQPISIRETSHVQHLYSQGTALLKEKVTDFDLLHLLHPTPALAGFPQKEAKQIIQQLESFSRGFYGGIVGWSTPESSDWIVAIRSCFIEKQKATLFSGTGIVEGSHPDLEWEELDHKLELYRGIFL